MDISILHIDDDEDDIDFFKMAIWSIDKTIPLTSIASGVHALQMLKNRSKLPSHIFVDLNMPKFTGFDFLIEIKKDERLSEIPVIVLSTSKSDADREQALKLGAVNFVTKPNSFAEFHNLLNNIIWANSAA